MSVGARGLATTVVVLLCLGACSQQQWRSTRDNTLGFFGIARKPAVAKVSEPPPAPAAPVAPAAEEEPVPSAAPRTPVETEGVAPPPGGRINRKS